MRSLFNPFKVHKYWASKPLDVAVEYIEKYASPKKVLCDPFAGSGVFCYAGLLRGKDVIFNDLDPFALFLARNTIKPVNIRELYLSYKEVLERPLDRAIETRQSRTIIAKGTSVKSALEWLYESTTNLDGHRTKINVDYFTWDTEYEISNDDAGSFSKDDARLGHFLKICLKTRNGWKYRQSDVTNKWKIAVESNRDAWLSKTKKKKIEPALVTSFSAILVREGIAKRTGRFPILKSFRYSATKGRKPKHAFEELNTEDWQKIRAIESAVYPYPIPETELSYLLSEEERNPFETVRPHVVFVAKEALSTIEQEDYQTQIPRFKHYFTKRNLLALTILFWSIGGIKDFELREQIYYIFTCKLHKLAKFESPNVRWGVNSYIVQPNFVEQNALSKFMEAFKEVAEAKQRIAESLGNSYKDTTDVGQFVESLSRKDGPNILWLRADAKKLQDIFSRYRRIVDLVFTDPPYVGLQDSIYYFELTSFYTSWLKLDPDWKGKYGGEEWWRDEIIQNDKQRKSFEDYLQLLRSSLISIDALTTEDALWIVTYHSASKEVFEGVRNCFSSVGLRVPPYEEIQARRIRATGKGSLIVQKYGSIGDDAYIVMEKGPTREPSRRIPADVESERKLVVSIMNSMKREIRENNGLVDWRMFSRAYPNVVWKEGAPPGGETDMKALFEKYCFAVSPEFRVLDRDLVGEDEWMSVYGSIDEKQLLQACLIKYVSAREGRIKRAEAIYGIISKLNSRFRDELIETIFKTLFSYDWKSDEYRLIDVQKTLQEFVPKAKIEEKEVRVLIPEEVVTAIERTCKDFGHSIVYKRGVRPRVQISEAEKQFDLMVQTAKKEMVLVSINNETAIRAAWAARIRSPIIYISYSERIANIKALTEKLDLVVIPHQEHGRVISAFKDYDPVSTLRSSSGG